MNSSLERARKLQIGGTYAFFVIGSIIMIFPFCVDVHHPL